MVIMEMEICEMEMEMEMGEGRVHNIHMSNIERRC